MAKIFSIEHRGNSLGTADHTWVFRNHNLAEARLQARLGMTEFREIRQQLRTETEELSKPFRSQPVVYPPGFEMRATRVSFANYLLDTLGDMLEIATKRKSESLLLKFESARKGVAKLLDGKYFGKTADEIKAGYLEFEEDFIFCASHCGIRVLEPEHAVAAYNKKLAERCDEINGVA